MAEPTLFELIVAGAIPSHKVAEGKNWYAFLDIYPRSEGHTLVVPKRGVQRLADLNSEEKAELLDGVTSVQSILSSHFNTTDFTICVHDGPLAGQEVPHVHIHVIPRMEGDGGKTLLSMFPDAPPIGGDADHAGLAQLAEKLQGV